MSGSSSLGSKQRQETVSGDVSLDNFPRRLSRTGERTPAAFSLFPSPVPPILSNSGILRSRESSRDQPTSSLLRSGGGQQEDDEDDLHQPLTSSQWLENGSNKGEADTRSVTSDTPPLTHEHFLSPRALRKNIFGGWGATASSSATSPFSPMAWNRKVERIERIDPMSETGSIDEGDNLLNRLQIHTPRVVHFLQFIGLLPPLPGDSCLWSTLIYVIYCFVRLLVPYFFFNALLSFGFNVGRSIREAWFLEGTMFYVLVFAQLAVQIPYVFRVQRRIRNTRTKEPTTLLESGHEGTTGSRTGMIGLGGGGMSRSPLMDDSNLYLTDDDDSLFDGESGHSHRGRGGHNLNNGLEGSMSEGSAANRMNASLSEVCSDMIEVTAMNDFLPNAVAFFAVFLLWLLIICLIPQLLWNDILTLTAYLIELTSISCLTVNLMFIGTDCRILYHYMNELCSKASYQKLTQDDISKVRKLTKVRSRVFQITNNSVIFLAFVNVAWFIFRVFFTHWSQRMAVVYWILAYFKDLIFLLIVFNESARVNERANQLNSILSQRMWHNGDVNSNLNRLSMFANLTNEPLGYVLGNRRWTTADMIIYAGIIVLISLLVLIRSILMQFSLSIL